VCRRCGPSTRGAIGGSYQSRQASFYYSRENRIDPSKPAKGEVIYAVVDNTATGVNPTNG
jgi:hypothetical protein